MTITYAMIWAAAEVIRSSRDGLGASVLARKVLEAAERAAFHEEPVGYATQDDLDAIADGTVISVGLMWPDVIKEPRGDYLVPLYTRPLPTPGEPT